MCWLRVYAWLRVKIKLLRVPVFGVFSPWLCAGYASTRGYASKSMLRVRVFVIFSRGAWMKERGSLLCAGYASTRGYASKLNC